MSEEQDESSKTEEPTQKKLEDAKKKGQVAISREVGHWISILSATLVVGVFAPLSASILGRSLYPYIEKPHDIALGGSGIGGALLDTILQVGLAMALPMLALMLAGVAGNLIQTGFIVSGEQMKLDLNKLSPLKGFKRLFGMKSLVEFIKGIFKLALVGVVATMLVLPLFSELENFVGIEPLALLKNVQNNTLKLMGGVFAVMTVIAGADLLFQRLQHIKQMRMTKQEVKDEYKQSEGDPMVKARLRQLRMDKSKKRMMSQVPSASVVITNPTHYAVALKYEKGEIGAPIVVAKGMDAVALRIREIAKENEVPIVENPPLARALFAAVEVDQEIPAEHYKAVAEVIAYIFGLKKGSSPTIH